MQGVGMLTYALCLPSACQVKCEGGAHAMQGRGLRLFVHGGQVVGMPWSGCLKDSCTFPMSRHAHKGICNPKGKGWPCGGGISNA